MTEWFGKNCKFQINQWEDDEITGGKNYRECKPGLIFCNHPNNPKNIKSNCYEKICPMNIKEVKIRKKIS